MENDEGYPALAVAVCLILVWFVIPICLINGVYDVAAIAMTIAFLLIPCWLGVKMRAENAKTPNERYIEEIKRECSRRQRK